MEPPNLAPPSYWEELGKALGHQSFQFAPPFRRGFFPFSTIPDILDLLDPTYRLREKKLAYAPLRAQQARIPSQSFRNRRSMPPAKAKVKKAGRKKTPVATETSVLVKSRRVCSLCWALRRDGRSKPGQIAHSNRKRDDASEKNLVWLCLPCHDDYDTSKSQSKNVTINELRAYKSALEADVCKGLLPCESGSGGALLDLNIHQGLFIDDTEGPRIEVRLSIANMGSKATGLRAIEASFGNDSAGRLDLTEKVGPSARKCTDFRADATFLTLESGQMIEAGQLMWCAAQFIPSEHALRTLPARLSDKEAFQLEVPLIIRISPVSGPDCQASVLSWAYHTEDRSIVRARLTMKPPGL